jgi:hypothetical protein
MQDEESAGRAPIGAPARKRRSGRAVPPVRLLARRQAEAAVAALAVVMEDAQASAAARVSAASALLNWAYGKTATERQDTAKDGGPALKVIKLQWADPRATPRDPAVALAREDE